MAKRIKSIRDRSDSAQSLESLLGIDANKEPFEGVAQRVQHLSRVRRQALLAACQAVLTDPVGRKQESVRVSAAKALIALIPDSKETIRSFLEKRSDVASFEFHFSVFCFLDKTPNLPNAEHFTQEVPILVEQYLLNLRTETARAGWMAGEMLGEHWPEAEALPTLRRVARSARFVAGRLGALHGLAHALSKMDGPKRESVIGAVNQIAKYDRSSRVRSYATQVLQDPSLL